MAEFDAALYDLISSQISLQNKCRTVSAAVQSQFEDRLIHKHQRRPFYLEFTEPSNGSFFVWIYRANKSPTSFGLKCFATLCYMELRLVQFHKKENGDEEVLKYGTHRLSNLFPNGNSKYVKENQEIVAVLHEIAQLLVTVENPETFLKKSEKNTI